MFDKKYDASIAKPTASESGTNRDRATPTINNDGTNTASTASIASNRGVIVSRVASQTAWRNGSPRDRCVWMFSMATVDSSTRMPMASANPPSVMMLIVCPVSHRPTTPARTANGIVVTTISALRRSRRNNKTIKPVNSAPNAPSKIKPRIEFLTMID
ncbi:MAG: hypothetical protein JMDDDDMK_05049 [Acidobacteria bacterium]|nr:hypothetical protein [Acidobacteriota bacterium]